MEPYAYEWDRSHTAAQLQELYKHLGNGEESNSDTDCVSIAGRIVARRAFGKLAFLTLRDDSGTIQVSELACFHGQTFTYMHAITSQVSAKIGEALWSAYNIVSCSR